MADNTGIEWTDATWNPVTGCTKVSPGCDHCYAETIAHRFDGTKAYPNGFHVTLRPERLLQPTRWRRPRRIFVNSMADLFHDDVPDDYIGEIFDVMAAAPQHTFQILTKRHARMRSVVSGLFDGLSPLPNVWLGVSAENQHWVDIRIPALLDTPASVRFISAEPLLGPIDLTCYLHDSTCAITDDTVGLCTCFEPLEDRIDWVIVGGESGHGARPMHPAWARSLREQCDIASEAKPVAFLFKQWGGRTPKAGGRELDSRTWDQYPGMCARG